MLIAHLGPQATNLDQLLINTLTAEEANSLKKIKYTLYLYIQRRIGVTLEARGSPPLFFRGEVISERDEEMRK